MVTRQKTAGAILIILSATLYGPSIAKEFYHFPRVTAPQDRDIFLFRRPAVTGLDNYTGTRNITLAQLRAAFKDASALAAFSRYTAHPRAVVGSSTNFQSLAVSGLISSSRIRTRQVDIVGGMGTTLFFHNTESAGGTGARAKFYLSAGDFGYSHESFTLSEKYDGVDFYHLNTFQRSLFLGGRSNVTSDAAVTILNSKNNTDGLKVDGNIRTSGTLTDGTKSKTIAQIADHIDTPFPAASVTYAPYTSNKTWANVQQAIDGTGREIPSVCGVIPGRPAIYDGAPASVAIGSTITGNSGTAAAVTNSGTIQDAVFNFTIPRGDTGSQGNSGTLAVGTVITGVPGSAAVVTNSGTLTDAIFNFTIPRGLDGDINNLTQAQFEAKLAEPGGKIQKRAAAADTETMVEVVRLGGSTSLYVTAAGRVVIMNSAGVIVLEYAPATNSLTMKKNNGAHMFSVMTTASGGKVVI